jgi:tetratricopeptide (TPR) repeat protein
MQRVRALAITDLRRILEYDNPPSQAKLLLSQLLAMPGGDRPEALKLLDDLFDDEQVAALPAKVRAEALTLRATLQSEPDKARADYDQAVELDPDEAEHRLARADFLRQQHKLDEALADIDAILTKDPEDAPAFLLKAQVLREQEKYDEALASLDKASALAPGAPGPYQQRGEIYRQQGEFAKAIEQFNKVLQMQPGLVLTLIHRAESYLNNRQFDEALVDIEAVLKDNPGLTVAHGLRAQALASLNRLPEAIDEMKALAEAEPEQLEFRMQLALYYVYNQQPRKAIAEYGEILNRDAGNFLALRGRADAYLNIGDHKAAIADFEEAIKREPDDTGVLNNFAWVLATSPDDDVRNGSRAIELAAKACELTSYEKTHILSTLAAAYAETGDFDKAREWSKKAVELFAAQRPEHESEDGKEAADKMAGELADELKQFEAGKPWRERQTAEEAATPSAAEAKAEEPKPADPPASTPATAEAPPKGA